METISTTCHACEGKRYIPTALKYTFQGKNISDILDMTIQEAGSFFKNSAVSPVLERLKDVGLDYITLGQPMDTLSGGELQRVKLASELESHHNVYILDEPTTGLHMSDIAQLMKVLNRLVDQGNTLIVIEHNLDVVAGADWVIDMGPGAGQAGGKIVFEGEPQRLLEAEQSVTGQYLKRYIEHRKTT